MKTNEQIIEEYHATIRSAVLEERDLRSILGLLCDEVQRRERSKASRIGYIAAHAISNGRDLEYIIGVGESHIERQSVEKASK